jgi:hypothetical protein
MDKTMTRQHAWGDLIDDQIRQVASNYRDRMGQRGRPALLCIDNYNAVFGDKRGITDRISPRHVRRLLKSRRPATASRPLLAHARRG